MGVEEKMTNQIKTNKNLNLELLRIVAMLLIIIGHTIGHTHLLDAISPRTINYYLVSLLQIISYPATNIYVMISGYLLCDKRFNTKRIALIWIQVFFYSLLLFLATVLIGAEPFSIISFIKVILPISGNQYWFARVYIGLYLLIPFINKFLSSLNKRSYQAFGVVCFVLFSFWRSFVPFATTLNNEGGNSIIWFIILYCFAAYIKLYGGPERLTIKKQIICIMILLLFSFSSRLVITYISNLLGLGGAGASLFTEFTSFPMLFSAWLIINLVVGASEFFSENGAKIILWFSSSTFSIYLIHENQYVKKVIWNLIDMPEKSGNFAIVLIIFGVALGIFIICTIIDKILFVQLNKLLKYIKFEKIQTTIDSYLYTE